MYSYWWNQKNRKNKKYQETTKTRLALLHVAIWLNMIYG